MQLNLIHPDAFDCNLTALESAHALWGAMEIAKTLPKDANVVVVSRSIRPVKFI